MLFREAYKKSSERQNRDFTQLRPFRSAHSFSMSFPKISHSQATCGDHPFFPMPLECMKCAFYEYKRAQLADTPMTGTSDLDASIYLEPPSMLYGNGPYTKSSQTSMRFGAPAVNMTYLKPSQQPRIISTTFFAKESRASITTEDDDADDYPERFALSPSPKILSTIFFMKERRESITITISDEDDEYPERLALSPIQKHDNEQESDYKCDPDMPSVPRIVVEDKTALTKSSKTITSPSPKRRSTRLSRSAEKELDENSDNEDIEAEPNLIFVDKTGGKFYEDDTIEVDVPGSEPKEDDSASSEDDEEACAVCRGRDSKIWNEIVFCDGCNTAVHQKCYGVTDLQPGRWFCRECQPQKKKGKGNPCQSATPTNPRRTQSTKRKRNSQDNDEAEQQKIRKIKRARCASIIVISDDEEEQKKPSRRVTQRKRLDESDSEVKSVSRKKSRRLAPPSKRRRDADSDRKTKRNRAQVSSAE